MIQGRLIRGALVRRGTLKGAISKVSLPWITCKWEDETVTTHRRGDPNLMDTAEIFTSSGGWVPLSGLLASKNYLKNKELQAMSKLNRPMESAMARFFGLLREAGNSSMSPFKRKSVLGPTNVKKFGNPPSDTAVHKKQNYWKCACANYKCTCKGKNGETKHVVINKAYKKAYNKAFSKWTSSLRKKTGSRRPTVSKTR